MLDIAFIRNHPDIVKEAARVKYNPIDIDYLLEVDRQVLELQRRVEDARAEQNKISNRIRAAGKDRARREALIAEGKLLAGQIKAMEPLLHELEETRRQLLYLVPNVPDPSSPIGKDESDNVRILCNLADQQCGIVKGSPDVLERGVASRIGKNNCRNRQKLLTFNTSTEKCHCSA